MSIDLDQLPSDVAALSDDRGAGGRAGDAEPAWFMASQRPVNIAIANRLEPGFIEGHSAPD